MLPVGQHDGPGGPGQFPQICVTPDEHAGLEPGVLMRLRSISAYVRYYSSRADTPTMVSKIVNHLY